MPKAYLKDGTSLNFEKGETAGEIIGKISQGLLRNSICASVNGNVVGLDYCVDGDCEILAHTFDDIEGKKTFWHTTSHILAQAVKRLYKDVKLTIGPSIDNGFYYDFDTSEPFTPEMLLKIEDEMRKIVKEDLDIKRTVMSREEALAFVKNAGENYKEELIADINDGDEISFYTQGEFTDLCAGPHMATTGKIKAIKLLSCTGAYWRGDSKNKMLSRIYGISFPKASMLTEYLEKVEEAKKRDHNKIGRELSYFTTSDMIGQGLPILMPKGARVIQLLQRFVEDEEEKRGYLLTKTPFMAKSDLYKVSGHWYHYKENMFILGDEEKDGEAFALRPMTCPFQFQVYLAKKRSYRDLPMRLAETSTLFRNEASGEMHGLIRVRQFTISEGHLACLPSQLEQEFKGCLELAVYFLKTLGLDSDVTYRFSKWDENDTEKYIGTKEQWDNVQDRMKEILDDLGIDYEVGIGEAAFYGPKLDIQIKNVHGKEDTLITIQIDFQLAERFKMEYVDEKGETQYPYVIHRTSIGCYERTLALLLEKYAGALPVWLSPTQVMVLPIGISQHEYAEGVLAKLREAGIRCEIDERNEKIGYKIREAQLEKTPYMLIIGEKEANEGTASVRNRKGGDLGAVKVSEFIDKITDEIKTKAHD